MIGFAVCAIIIFFAGKKLSFYGDLIAEITGLGKAWIGLILMASVTSLPELVVGISSSAIVQSPDLAVGDIMGSCAFNLCILALLDIFAPPHKSIFSLASTSHALAISLGIILVGIAGLGMFLPNEIVILPWLGGTSLVFLGVYLMSVRLMYRFEQKNKTAEGNTAETEGLSITPAKVTTMFTIFACIIVGAALFLPYFAEQICEQTGIDKSFAGTLFLAVSTSLPEIAVSVAAVRMGAVDLAVGNLVGSNIFNIAILAIDDVFYTKGHLLKDASDANLISVLSTIIMSAIAIIGLTYRPGTKRYLLGWDALLIFAIYVINLVLLYNYH
jgi:cation:H+ antiporter